MVDSAYCISLHGSLIVIYSAIFLFGSQFHKHIADGWNCSIPYCCSVNVIACERPDTASYLNYLVRLKGIAGEERRISICETLQNRGKLYTITHACVILIYLCLFVQIQLYN